MKRRIRFILAVFLICLEFGATFVQAGQKQREQQEEETRQKLMEDMELGQMQDAVNQILKEDSFSIEEILNQILKGESLFQKETMSKWFKNIVKAQLQREQKAMFQVVLLVLLAAVFSNFTAVFGDGKTGETSFYITYMLLLALLIKSFGSMGVELKELLENFILFLKALMPSYFLAVTASSGSATAMIFYEAVLFLIYVIQVVFLKGIVPAIYVLALVELVNYLHSEDFLSKMAELLQTLIEWSLKSCMAVVLGMQLIQNMIGPAMDSLKRDIIGKTAASIPGIGNAINGVTEVALGTAVIIRNGIGVVGIIILVCIGIRPVIRLALLAFLYKLLAAVVQPVSDKRMTGALSTIGNGYVLFLKVLLCMELLIFITIAILSISFIGK
ncbi:MULTISPECIES: stage III sporulation protein AE [unclassified Bacillota]|nr:stage III sporulation protein AE [Firmicutes bacterium AM10-47]RHV47729.1 stage III sporulation protein AE [Firmicutes bacterium OM04-13BH]